MNSVPWHKSVAGDSVPWHMCETSFCLCIILRKDNKVFGLYRSMIEKEAEKINSAVLKYIIMFVVIISLCKVLGAFCPGRSDV